MVVAAAGGGPLAGEAQRQGLELYPVTAGKASFLNPLKLARLAAELKRVDDMLSATGMGLVALDKDGKIIMKTSAASAILGEEEDQALPPALLEFLASGQEDLFAGRVEFLNRQPLEDRDRLLHILEANDHPILSEEGELLGVILKKVPKVP